MNEEVIFVRCPALQLIEGYFYLFWLFAAGKGTLSKVAKELGESIKNNQVALFGAKVLLAKCQQVSLAEVQNQLDDQKSEFLATYLKHADKINQIFCLGFSPPMEVQIKILKPIAPFVLN